MSDNKKPKKKNPPYAQRRPKAVVSAKARKAVKGSPVKNIDDRTPTQIAQIEKRGPVPEGMQLHPYIGNKFALGNKGRPAAYETPEELEWWINAYFLWIKGEYVIKQVERKNPKTKRKELVEVKEWIREPELPMRTTLVLFLGLSTHSALQKIAEKSSEFEAVVDRGLTLVESGYERDLRNSVAANGAKFALSNMGWRNTQAVQNLDKNGKPTDPAAPAVIHVNQLAENIGKI